MLEPETTIVIVGGYAGSQEETEEASESTEAYPQEFRKTRDNCPWLFCMKECPSKKVRTFPHKKPKL
jgi:hypothetical protein